MWKHKAAPTPGSPPLPVGLRLPLVAFIAHLPRPCLPRLTPILLSTLSPHRQELDKHVPLHVSYWAAAALVAEHELYEEQKREDIDRAK